MARRCIRHLKTLFLTAAVTASVSPNVYAIAMQPGIKFTSQDEYNSCIAQGSGKYYCLADSYAYDPTFVDVTGVTLSIQYDPLVRVFDQSKSGPLGIFSIGGDAPPPTPGIGTQPMKLLPNSGYTPGTPLPGSTLTYTNVAGLLTINYQFSNPVTVNNEVNFFLVTFDFVNPMLIDLSQSTVTYEAAGRGSDLSTVSFTCSTKDMSGACGSNSPSSGISDHFATVPEPSTPLLLACGMAALVLLRRLSIGTHGRTPFSARLGGFVMARHSSSRNSPTK